MAISSTGANGKATLAKARRQRLHHLLVAVQGERLIKIEDPPDTSGLLEWLQEPPPNETYFIPVRRLQRILTDIERARNGIYIEALGKRITILPHVYVPGDQSVPAMFAERGQLTQGPTGTGYGHRDGGFGAAYLLSWAPAEVVATDFNPNAVRNVRLNAEVIGTGGPGRSDGSGRFIRAGRRGEHSIGFFLTPPWIKGHPQSLYDTGLYDPDYRVLDGFFKGALQHLAPGKALFCCSIRISPGAKGRTAWPIWISLLAANASRNKGELEYEAHQSG